MNSCAVIVSYFFHTFLFLFDFFLWFVHFEIYFVVLWLCCLHVILFFNRSFKIHVFLYFTRSGEKYYLWVTL